MTTELRIVRSLIAFFHHHRLAVIVSVVLGILSSFAEGVGVALFIPFIQLVTDGGVNTSTGAPYLIRLLDGLFAGVPPERRLLVICLGILGAVLAKALLYYIHGVLLSYLDWKMGQEIRSRLTGRILTMSFRQVERRDLGDLLNTLSSESWNATDALSVVLDIMVTACTLLVYLVLLLLISPQLTALALVAMLGISLTVRFLTRHVKEIGQAVTKENAALATRMLETVEGNKTIRTFGRERYEQGRFDTLSEKLGALCWRLGCVRGLLDPVYEVGGAMLLVFILYTSAQDPANLGPALVFIFALYRAQPRMAALDGASVSLRSAAASIDAVNSLLNGPDAPPRTVPDPRPFRGLTRELCFEGASFKYNPDDSFAIRDLSVRFPARKTTALVGPSGAGKSTIIKLLLRLYDPEHGEIRADGKPLEALDLETWRERIAVVSQDTYVFNATVRDNIAYGRLGASDEEIIDAARQAHAHDFIVNLPHGYLTRVGDRGVRLSTGQLQRLTLARAIVRDPDILVLDEATNSVDGISERLIQDALERFAATRTVIIIAHRFSTIERADHIVVLEHGRLREQGTLEELLERRGLFSRLYASQRQVPTAAGPPSSPDTTPGLALLDSDRAAGSPWADPLISIIIPCHDQGHYLDRAIDSALSQTYRRREVVVVDDGSSDSTAGVAARHPDVIYVHQPHRGLAAARNAGIDASRGELLVFLDADDRLLPDALASGLECLRAHPGCGFVFGAHRTVTGEDDRRDPAYLPTMRRYPYLELLSRNIVAMHACVLFRREAVLAVGNYDPTLKASEDYDLCLRIARRFPVACHTRVVAEYWKHEGNMSRDPGLMLEESLRALRKQKAALESVDERAAYLEGIRSWRRYYGGQQWEVVARRLKQKEFPTACRATLVLLRLAPSVLAARAGKQSIRTIRALTSALRSRAGALVNRLPLESGADVGDGDGLRSPAAPRPWRRRPSTRTQAPPIVLLYHRVADVGSDPWGLAVSPKHFRDHLQVLARERECISLDDLVRELAAGRLPSGAVCITFDDGYADNLFNAKPLLEEFSIPATFFLTSGYLQGDSNFWWDALERPFFQKTRIPATLELEVERALLSFDFAGDTEYRDTAFAAHRQWRAWDPPLSRRHLAYHDLWQALHRVPSATREMLLGSIHDWAAVSGNAAESECRPLTAGEVGALADGRGIWIGGHSVTHPSLPALDRDAQRREIVENKRHLEELLDRPLRHFAYPHGELDGDTVTLLEEAGYEAAFTTRGCPVDGTGDLFRLPRIAVEDWGATEFAHRLAHHFVEP